MERYRTRFILIAGTLVLTLAIGTAGFVIIDHYPSFDAFYMTLITISTVGYSEMHPLSRGGRIFNSFLIIFGVTIMLLAIGSMTQAIIELELNQYFGKRRIKKMIDHLQDHYIVCGFGRVGRGAAAELQRAGSAVPGGGQGRGSRGMGHERWACWRCWPTPPTTKRCATPE